MHAFAKRYSVIKQRRWKTVLNWNSSSLGNGRCRNIILHKEVGLDEIEIGILDAIWSSWTQEEGSVGLLVTWRLGGVGILLEQRRTSVWDPAVKDNIRARECPIVEYIVRQQRGSNPK